MMNATYYYDDFEFPDPVPEIQPIQIVALVFYGLVVLLGVPGNAVVVWVTGFCMQRSVTSIWFLNLALADLLCCLSIPLLMVPLVHDDHWHFGPVACTVVKSLFYLVMYCSILQLVFISVDRWLLVSKPVWCQNKRRPKQAAIGCVIIWILALIVSIPHFVFYQETEAGGTKRECVAKYSVQAGWTITCIRFLLGFFFPFLVIVISHVVVYHKAESGLSKGRGRSKRMLRVIIAVVLSFFLCWLPLNILDFVMLATPPTSPHHPTVHIAHFLALCLAYFNSCLNPLLYVCLGRGFKDSMNRSLRNILQFITEEPTGRVSVTNETNDTKSSSTGKEMTQI